MMNKNKQLPYKEELRKELKNNSIFYNFYLWIKKFNNKKPFSEISKANLKEFEPTGQNGEKND